MREIMASMVDYFRENRGDVGKGLELLPGVRQLLETLSSHPDVVFGLVSPMYRAGLALHSRGKAMKLSTYSLLTAYHILQEEPQGRD